MKQAKFLGLCLAIAGLFVIKATLGDDLSVSGEFTNNGLNVVISAPEGFTDRVEIYTCSNLASGNWRVATENLRPSDSNPAQWYTEAGNSGFFVAGNMDVDSDGDGLPDAREKFVHKTDPNNADSDGDGMPDAWEVNAGTDPLINDVTEDPDGDGLTNLEEYQNGTNPLNPDTDGDGLTDGDEIHIYHTNPTCVDTDGDGLTDGDEIHSYHTNPLNGDTDGDGLCDSDEINIYGTDPLNSDTDGDGMPDGWELAQGFDPLSNADAAEDADNDGLTNAQEYTAGTDPYNSDTDRDGLSDGDEIHVYHTNPRKGDTDFDGMPDGWEVLNGLNPLANDTEFDPDGDGLTNLQEYQNRTDPNNPDTDGDGLTDGDEINIYHTNPKNADTDDDGMPDGWEVQHALNPLSKADALFDPDGDGFNNLEAYQTSPDLSVPDTDGDGFIDSYDLSVDKVDYPVVGAGVCNVVASSYNAGYLPAIGFNGDGTQLLTLRWGDSFWYPADYGDRGQVFSAGSSQLHWSNEKFDTMMESYVTAYWYFLWFVNWESSLPKPLCNYTLDPWHASQADQEVAEYVSVNPDLINIPAGDKRYIRVLATQTDDSQRTSYLCAVLTTEYSEPAPPTLLIDHSGRMSATGGGLESYGTTRFKFVFNQPVTNKIIKWLTYHYDYDQFAYVDYAVHQYEVSGKESALFCNSSQSMIAPSVDLNGDFDLDGDVDEADTVLRASATASLLVVPSGQTDETPGGGTVPVTVGANFFETAMPESVLRVKFSGIEPGEHFRLWSTTDVIPELRPRVAKAVGGGDGRTELIEDQPLLIDTGAGLEHEWPVKNISSLIQGPSYIYKYDYSPPFPKTLYLECVSCTATNDGKAKIELVYEYNGEEICAAALPITVIRSKLVPDWNHDRSIDMADQNQDMNGAPFRFWINDDHDTGDISEGDSDVPGQSGKWNPFKGPANHEDNIVNGHSDLLDFFPVWLDINLALKRYPITDGTVYKLRQADDALKFVYTDLTHDQAGDFLITSNSTCGVAMNQNSYNADTIRVASTGTVLNVEFLNRIIANTNKGVLMMEAVNPSTSPLVLEIWQNGSKVWETRLALSLSGVEDMYRKVNLRNMQNPEQQASPTNNPDELSNGKNVVFLHGFSVDEQAARGWHAEMFKRLYWSGSRAMFHAVTWRGDEGLIDGLHYQDNVANAFLTAPHLATYVNGIVGDKIIMGHSLGNMVISGAIQDYSMSVDKYFMLNAAVATECYRPASFNDATAGNYMLHEDWTGYNSNTWCSTWFRLFSSPDDRAKLTWKNRFPAVLPVAYNFYSSGDEIFEVKSNATPSSFSGGVFHLERYAWQKQELFKGREIPGGTSWAGWGFAGHQEGEFWVHDYTMEEANVATEAELRTNAVFYHNPNAMFSSNITAQVQNDIVAQGVPALSYAAGGNSINIPGFYNYNMDENANKLNGWGRDDDTYYTRWLHSDLKNMAFLYTYELFNELVTQGDLQ